MHRVWGAFDALNIRAIDDLAFAQGRPPESHRVILCTIDPPRAAGAEAVAVPLQIALERCFFHIQGVSEVVINPRRVVEGLPLCQAGIDFSLPLDALSEIVLDRVQLAEVVGHLQRSPNDSKSPLSRAARALSDNSLFEAFSLARAVRIASERANKEDSQAWFIETLSASYLGLSEEALNLYERHPKRGSSDPDMHLLNARFRLLLRQFNEARTILHTLSFQPEVGELASTELARSFLMEGEYARALDNTQAALSKYPGSSELKLIRGLAQRSLSYPSGEEAGLLEALQDFEAVAKAGGLNAPEALFHAGVVFARLGRLHEAETALRQSLFQRDRFASRDALVRILAARGDRRSARVEFEAVSQLKPEAVSELAALLSSDDDEDQVTSQDGSGPLDRLASSGEIALLAAEQLLKEWRLPVAGDVSDFAALDDFFDYYGPSGSFCTALEYAFLNDVGRDVVARAVSLYLCRILATLDDVEIITSPRVALVVRPMGGKIPMESFVKERIVLGASRDNFSSLESLLVEFSAPVGDRFAPPVREVGPWAPSDQGFRMQVRAEVEWIKELLAAHSVSIDESLRTLEVLDAFIDERFEAGGELKAGSLGLSSEDIQRFIVGCGLLVGTVVESNIPCEWYQHVEANGVSLVTQELGRIFPVARMHRRVALAAAADYGSRLSALSIGVGTASAMGKVQSGEFKTPEQVERFLLEHVPGTSQFSPEELQGLVQAILPAGDPTV
jgi:tetratricopeptide (TPR) repeat protein